MDSDLSVIFLGSPYPALNLRQGGDSAGDAEHVHLSDALIQNVMKGEFEKVLSLDCSQQLLRVQSSNSTSLLSSITENTSQYLTVSECEDARKTRELHVLGLAVACLELFVQDNWTGPPTSADPSALVPDQYKDGLAETIQAYLETDGESIYSLTRHPLYLLITRCILYESRRLFKHFTLMHRWWLMRCLKIHQDLLQERSPSLKETIMLFVTDLSADKGLAERRSLYLEFLLEASHLSLFYYEHTTTKNLLKKAAETADMTAELTGVMGKRTKFQDFDLAQLTCLVSGKPDRGEHRPEDHDTAILPTDIPLDSEVLLEKVKLNDSVAESDHICLSPVESAFVMTLCLHNKRSQASTDLEEEETKAYVECILSHRSNWATLSKALMLRSQIERKRPKRLERSLFQMEELLNQFRHEQPPAIHRLPLVHASQLSPIWVTERELAQLYISIGSLDTALEIFTRLQTWSEVIECYQALGRREKAESVIRQQLAIKETADLYCYLGDATGDLQCYEKAWEVSNGRSSRAQRSWAIHLFCQGLFAESLPHFDKSLEINHLQAGLWFTYGCACMAEDSLNKATTAFRSCVNLEYDNYQAWNNLSACLAKSNDKPKAFRILEEALKCNYENKRIWENYVLIGLDCGEFEKVIRGYHRMLDLNEKYADTEVLSILVRAVNEGLLDGQGQPSGRLRQKVQELFGRQTSVVTTNSEVWKLYGQLVSHETSSVADKAEKAILHYQKSQRCLTQTDDFLTDRARAALVVTESDKLLQEYLSLSDDVSNRAQAIQMLTSAKLTTTNLLTKVKNKHRDLMGNLLPEVAEPCAELEAKLQQLISKISQLTNS